MSNVFNSILSKKPKRNHFDLSFDHKLSCNMGELIPFMSQEAIPGDNFKVNAETMIRFAPLIAPIMHRVDVTCHFFFVPNRILWSGWEDWITGQSEDAPPTLAANLAPGWLGDYFGLPRSFESINGINALPFAAYNKIYNEYYRDQNLQTKIIDTLESGTQDDPTQELQKIRYRAWAHDYFTACLPWAQKGDEVTLPLIQNTGSMPVFQDNNNGGSNTISTSGDPAIVVNNKMTESEIESNLLYIDGNSINDEATSINDLRRAFRVQEWLEKNARGGTRYIENILAHFGVRSSDKRLNRPEYLGGTKNPVTISEVLQTSETAGSPQANMAGHAIGLGAGGNVNYFCEEHGYIMGIMSITPRAAYQQGIPRQFFKQDPYDYYWPSFAHIGEQPVLNAEIYYAPPSGEEPDDINQQTFGYIPRYSEYRYNASRISGSFRDTLNFWHMGRIFENRPQLNEEFIKCIPTTRIFAVESEEEHSMWCHVFCNIQALRPIPKYGTPLL